MRSSANLLRSFITSERASFAVKFAFLVPVLLGTAAGGMDLLAYKKHKSVLQAAADSAAVSAAREASLKGWNEKTADSIAQALVSTNLGAHFSRDTKFVAKTNVDTENRRVEITISQDHYPYFAASLYPSPQILVSAVATASGSTATCVIVTSEKDGKVLEMKGDAFVRANDCAAYSNSDDSKGISVKDTARLVADLTCSAGGFEGSTKNYSNLPVTNCPSVADPLSSRASLMDSEVNPLPCDHTEKLEYKSASGTISPGVYCAELKIKDSSKIELLPGNYVFKGAKFKVEKGAEIVGKKVSLIFLDDKASLELKHDSRIELSAPESGPMAGILMYAQPAPKAKKDRKFKIESKDAKQLIGTVYLPEDTLEIGGDKDGDGICDPEYLGAPPTGVLCDSSVGDVSAWTAIVAQKLEVTNRARLIINSNYDSSDVPVPDGIGPNNGSIRLVQ